MYTFVLDLDGGTYLYQVASDTLLDAVRSYVTMLSSGYPPGSPEKGLLLAECWRQDSPAKVGGLTGVWCLTASDEDWLAIVHIIGPG